MRRLLFGSPQIMTLPIAWTSRGLKSASWRLIERTRCFLQRLPQGLGAASSRNRLKDVPFHFRGNPLHDPGQPQATAARPFQVYCLPVRMARTPSSNGSVE